MSIEHAELLRQYVHEALAAKASGGSTGPYDELVSEVIRLKGALATDATAGEQLASMLRALSTCVSLTHERRHELLLKHLLDTRLWDAPQALRLELLDWLTHVVVANGALVQSCLQTLVFSLLPPPAPPAPDAAAGERWEPAQEQARVQDEVLAALEKVLLLVPTAGARLLPLVCSNFPHKLRDRNTQCLYLRAVFGLAECDAGAGIREGLLAGVLDHLVSLDVEIRWEDIAEAAGEEAAEEEGGLPPQEEPDIFELEGMSALDLAAADAAPPDASPRGAGAGARGGWEGGHALAQPAAGNEVGGGGGAPPVDEAADKLDSLMEMSLGHLARRAAAGQLGAAWATLLAAFERCVLLTHRSKFTQFLLFFACRQSPDHCCRAFLHLLLSRLTDKHQPPIARSACAAYAASFLARAAYCPEPLVVESLQRLADWCLKYARNEDRRGGLPPIPSSSAIAAMSADARAQHGAFYAACQALLYVACYHLEPLLRPPHRGRHGHGHEQPPAAAGAGAAGQGAAADGARGAAPGSAGASGGTPASADTPTGMRVHERREAGHVAQREACADAVRQLFSDAMPQLLQHSLDPLSGCARSVVAEFGRQARAQGFAELARLVRDWERRQGGGGGRAACQLQLFFPFDPYLLRRSAAHLDLGATYVHWRRGHPAGAPRADLESSNSDSSEGEEERGDGGSEMSDEEAAAAAGGQALSDVGSSSSSSDDDSGGSSSSSSGYDSSSDSDAEDLKRTRFGSMPGSSLGSDHRARKRPHLPVLFGGPAGSPTMGFAVPGSLSSGGSPPFGVSPVGVAPFGSGALPAFGGIVPAGGLHLGLSKSRP